MYKSLVVLLILTASGIYTYQASAQIFEPFNVRYMYLPRAAVAQADDPRYDETERGNLQLLETIVRFPVQPSARVLIVPEITYKRYFQSYHRWPDAATAPRDAHHFRVFFKGVIAINDRWNVLALGGVAQGLNRGASPNIGHIFYRVGTGFLRNLRRGRQFGLSALYIQEAKLVLPIVIYKGASANQKWQFDIEGPRAVVERALGKNGRLRYEQKLDNDRISYQDHGERPTDSYSYTHLNLSVGFSQRIRGPVFANVSAGLSPLHLLTPYDGSNRALDGLRLAWRPSLSASIYMSINPNDYVK